MSNDDGEDARPRNPKFVWVDEVARDTRLTPGARLTGSRLAGKENGDGSTLFAGVGELATLTGRGQRTVKRDLVALREACWLNRTRRGGRAPGAKWASEYELTIPDGWVIGQGFPESQGAKGGTLRKSPPESQGAKRGTLRGPQGAISGSQGATLTPPLDPPSLDPSTYRYTGEPDETAEEEVDRLLAEIGAADWTVLPPKPDETRRERLARQGHARLLRDEGYTGDDDPSLNRSASRYTHRSSD